MLVCRSLRLLSTVEALTGAEAPIEEVLTEAAASTAAGTLASAGADILTAALAAEALTEAAASTAAGTLASAGADIPTAALAVGRPCRPVT
ncbi:MAG: hypothetical protein WBC04_03640 [Candidatus Acidiferrales bacterium]